MARWETVGVRMVGHCTSHMQTCLITVIAVRSCFIRDDSWLSCFFTVILPALEVEVSLAQRGFCKRGTRSVALPRLELLECEANWDDMPLRETFLTDSRWKATEKKSLPTSVLPFDWDLKYKSSFSTVADFDVELALAFSAVEISELAICSDKLRARLSK